MKKPRLLLLLLLTSFVPLLAQETVNVTFTASTESGMYCPFNSVSVTNVTRGWTENLVYPDTVLVLTNTVNVAEYMGMAFCLGNAYPNPFTGETHVLLELPEKSDVLLQVVRVDGSEVVSQIHCFDAGTYRLKVSLSAPQMAFLSVTTAYGRQVTKLLHTGNGMTDDLSVDFVSTVTKSSGTNPTRLDATGEFEPGDVMRYEACLLDGGTTVSSTAVTQPLDGDELITLRFALDKPTVTTNEASNITHISAICGGDVTDAGGLMVTARGVCWSTMPNPTVGDSHTEDGTGIGDFYSYLSDLAVETHYYVRAYAINRLGTSYGNEVDFTTLPTPSYTVVVSANPTNGGTVSGGGTYQDGDTCTVHAYANAGFEFTNWIEKNSVVSTEADYTFVVNGNHDMVANFTQQTYTISVSANPTNGGTVSGGGTYTYGQWCTVHANANSGYIFTNWTENGNVVSTNANYSFTVTGNRTLVAHFTPTYTITVSASPSDGGTVSGGGTYTYGQWCTVHANANNGYDFTNWTENGNVVSTNANYNFQVTNSRVLVAHFTESSQIPEGAINGLFTINANGDQVYFSQGNLQYQASTNTWRFATNQYDFVGGTDGNGNHFGNVSGSSNNSISSTYSGWIDLFGWGTSGYNHNNACYQPWSTNETNSNYYAYGQANYNLYDQTGKADWGYNSISNGGTTNTWRTLTGESNDEWSNGEWNYVFNKRSASTVNSVPNARFAKAKVANVLGVILFPDVYTHPSGLVQPVCINQTGNEGWNGNDYTATEFGLMQDVGVVFLPAAGHRYGTQFHVSPEWGLGGYYFSASSEDLNNGNRAYNLFFRDVYVILSNSDMKYGGNSVRLVCPAEN